MKTLNKDFYNDVPSMVCEQLDRLITEYGNESWFETAWEEYRQHIKNTPDMDEMRMPGFVFKKFLPLN